MTTPSKSNNSSTPLGVVPGTPHYNYDNKHGQRSHGQGYDYHDPTGLQKGDRPGAYESGSAITMFGKIGFRPDQALRQVDHGTIQDIVFTRRYGTQGTFDIFLYFSPDHSTGYTGDFKSGVEFGFDVCQVDLDLTTLNPSVTAEADGLWRLRFNHGEPIKVIRAIVPYRTTVRDYKPIKLVDDYTYLVSEHYTAVAGHTGDSQPDVFKNQTDPDDSSFTDLTQDNVKLVWDAMSNKDVLDLDEYLHNYVERLDTTYQVQTLPLPTAFVKPLVGIPRKEYWKTQFNILEDQLYYTLGRSFYCLVVYRTYLSGPRSWRGSSPTSPTYYYGAMVQYDLLKTVRTQGNYDPEQYKGEMDNWQYTDYGRGHFGYFIAGSNRAWINDVDLLYVSNGETEPHSGYKSKTYYNFSDVTSNPFDVDYTQYSNAGSGEVKGMPDIEHIKLDASSYNVLFYDIGTDANTLPGGTQSVNLTGEIPESEMVKMLVPHVSGYSLSAFPSMTPYGYQSGTPRYPRERYSFPYDWRKGKNTTKIKPYDDAPCGGCDLFEGVFYEPVKYDAPAWLQHDPAMVGKPGLGEGGTSSLLYSVSAMVHTPDQYLKNEALRAYYKCCDDHNDKEIRLFIQKADPLDPVELDKQTTSHILINKQPTYNVKQHSMYDMSVDRDHAMDPTPVMKAFQSWGEPPAGDTLVNQLFVPDGALPASQVQWLSLSAGSLSGGSKPANSIPAPAPVTGARLQVTPSTGVTDFATQFTAKSWVRRFTNTGTGDFPVYLNNISNGFESSGNSPYSQGIDLTTNTITAFGDKLDDWNWSIIGSNGTNTWRRKNNQSWSFMLSAGEYVDVMYTSQNNSYAPGYEVESKYQAELPAPQGLIFDEITFDITF